MTMQAAKFAGLALATGLALVGAAFAQEAETPQQAPQVAGEGSGEASGEVSAEIAAQSTAQGLQGPDHVVITGRPVEEVARAFVQELAEGSRREDQLSRWDRRICPGVLGAQNTYAEAMLNRISQRAVQVGLDVGEPGCKPNILIVVTADPAKVAKETFDNNRAEMGWFQRGGQRTLGRDALKKFVASEAPVRWWHVSQTKTRDGFSVGEASGMPGAADAITNITGGSSRLSRSTRQDFQAAFLIVDARQLKGFTYGALADYLAMVALAQLDAEADTSSYSTVLNLFAERPEGVAAPAGMTEWDLAYLKGVYEMKRDARTANTQRRSIARSVTGELERE